MMNVAVTAVLAVRMCAALNARVAPEGPWDEKRRMNNGLLYLGSFFVMILAALFGAPYVIDWNGYRGVFEEEASKVLGRDVRVGGAVNVRFLPTPFVSFEKVRLADTTGQTGEPFIRADSFTMRLALSPLLRGAFEANEIELTRPVLSLALDGEGSGNWASLTLRPAELPFIPQNVALHSVRIIDGTVAVHGRDGENVGRVESLFGELSAESLSGPFNFKGGGRISGTERRIKIATDAAGADGSVRLRASLHGAEGADSYAFDGTLRDFPSRPSVAGELTGKLHLPPALKSDGTPGPEPAPVFDLKTPVAAGAQSAQFEAIELDFASTSEPQSLKGKGSAQWGGATPRFDVNLAAPWLDLDALSTVKGEAASLAGLKQLLLSFLASQSGSAAVRVDLAADQVKFGGEHAGALRLSAASDGDRVEIRELSGGLPGSARFDVSGKLSRGADPAAQQGERVFEGEARVRGVNFARVQAFARKSGVDIDVRSEGPFWISGRVRASNDRFELTEARADFSGQFLSGDLKIETGTKSKLSLSVIADKLDTDAFFPAKFKRAGAAARTALGLSPADAASAADTTRLRLSAGKLIHEGMTYQDVEAEIATDGATFDVPDLQATLPSGARVKVSGRVDTAAARGTLSYEAQAGTSAAVAELARLARIADIVSEPRLAMLPTLNIAGLVKMGHRHARSVDVTIDGLVGPARVTGEGGLDDGFAGWRTSPVRLGLNASAPQLADILRLAGSDAEVVRGLDTGAAQANFNLSGVLSDAGMSLAELRSEAFTATLSGTLTAPDNAAFRYAARGTINGDGRAALALLGISAPAGVGGTILSGPVEIASGDAGLTVTSGGIKAASATLKGQVSVSSAADGRKLSGDLNVDRASVAGLIAVLTEGQDLAAVVSDDAAAAVWPEAHFDMRGLEKLQGALKLAVGQLEVSEGLTVRDVSGMFAFAPGSVKATDVKATAANGPLTLTAAVTKSPFGVTLEGSLAADADLSAVHAGASGRARIELEGTGRGLSAANIFSDFTGKGLIKFADARHRGGAPALVSDAADAVLTGRAPSDIEAVSVALESGLASSSLAIGTRTVPLTVTRGDVKVDPFTIETPRGRARITTTASLSTLAVDSEWRIAALASPLPPPPEAGPDWKPATKGPLPDVAFIYTGSLGNLAALDVALDVQDLQRELAVRQMERKVEELDVLRKNDEARQLQELERRKAMEAARAEAAAAAAAARAQAQAEARARAQAEPAEDKMPPVLPQSNGTAIVPQAGPPEAAADDPAGLPSTEETGAPVVTVEPAAPPPVRAVAPRPPQTPRPPRARTRTTTDEINRALGGWP